jgi:hypothetical protein
MSHEAEYAALVGIDWADTKHDFCLRATGVEQEEYGVMGPMPEAIDHWARALAARFPGGKIAVCLEQSKGSLIYALLSMTTWSFTPSIRSCWRSSAKPSRQVARRMIPRMLSSYSNWSGSIGRN